MKSVPKNNILVLANPCIGITLNYLGIIRVLFCNIKHFYRSIADLGVLELNARELHHCCIPPAFNNK